jgi:hypothetical protein
MKALTTRSRSILSILLLFVSTHLFAQGDAQVHAKTDATQITVGDQARLFIEATHNAKQSRIEWQIPDSFGKLEVVEKGKIDTVKQGDMVTYKQRLLITGFDSGMFTIPPIIFPVVPNSGTPYTIQTEPFPLLVQTVAVDTTKPFKPIKGIMLVKSTWLDYLLYIIAGIIFIILLVTVILYFIRNKKAAPPAAVPQGPVETLQEKALRLLNELDQQQLWQKGQVKEYYIQLTDILRDYIEKRFHTPAMELTTDEILYKARLHKEMMPYTEMLGKILYTADLAKFAKAQPLPQEHVDTIEYAKRFVEATKPVILETPAQS